MDFSAEAVREEAILFGGSRSLVGIVTDPLQRQEVRPAVILLNAGIIHRVGPGCLYVKLARRLARLGFVVLRFDVSGVGDSPGRRDNLPFAKSSLQETQEAMDYLGETRGIRHFLLGGLCTGAVVAYESALVDPRVTGTLLINTQGLIPESEEEIQSLITSRANRRYYLRSALYNPASWLKLLRGGADFRDILGAVGLAPGARRAMAAGGNPHVERIVAGFRALTDRGTELFFLYSEGDPGIAELQIILGDRMVTDLRNRENVRYAILANTDHMFTLLSRQETFLELVSDWLQAVARRFETQCALPSVDTRGDRRRCPA
jgi:pimeloyl-ACP methyl ester carboxylesterase